MPTRRVVPFAVVIVALLAAACGGGTGTQRPSSGAASVAPATSAASSPSSVATSAATSSAAASSPAASGSAPASSPATSGSAPASSPAASSPAASSPAASSPAASSPAASSPAASGTGTGGSPGASLGGADISGTLQIFGFGCTTGDEIAKVRIAQFNKIYPGVTLNCNESGWDLQKFTAALNGNTPPDVVHAPRNVVADLAAQGVIVPFDQCIADRSINTSVFREAAMNQITIDGKIYGLPEFFNTRIVYINNKALSDAGLTAADVDTSDYQKLADLNTKLTKGKGSSLSRIGFDPKLPEFLPLWAKANGVDLASADGKTSQLDDPKIAEVLDALKGFYGAAGGYTTFNDFRGTWDFFGKGNEFAKDQIGAMPFEQWYINVLADTSPDVDFQVVPFKARDGSDITWSDGDSWAITAKAGNPNAACEFANVMTNAQTWIAAAQSRADTRAKDNKPNTGVYTANKAADDVIFNQIVDLSKFPSFDAAVKVVLSVQDKAFALPPIPGASKFEQAWRDAVTQIVSEGAPAAETMQTADQEGQAAIDEVAK